MIKTILKSITHLAIIAATWLLVSKELISFPEPVFLIFIGVILVGFANISKKKFKKN